MKEVEHTETYTCNFCGAKYKTRAGLWKHLKVCEYAPSEEEEEEPVEETGGISIFNDEGDEEADDEGYQCPACKSVYKAAFTTCKRCGAEVEFDE